LVTSHWTSKIHVELRSVAMIGVIFVSLIEN